MAMDIMLHYHLNRLLSGRPVFIDHPPVVTPSGVKPAVVRRQKVLFWSGIRHWGCGGGRGAKFRGFWGEIVLFGECGFKVR